MGLSAKRSHECERCTHECVRHTGSRVFYGAALLCFAVCAFAEPADWIYTARYVVTMDAQHRLIDDGAVAIRGERIVGVGPRAEIDRQFQAAAPSRPARSHPHARAHQYPYACGHVAAARASPTT